MRLTVDDDVGRIAEYMERTIPGDKLKNVARALVQLGELVWRDESDRSRFSAFGIAQEPMRPDVLQPRPEATPELRPDPSTH